MKNLLKELIEQSLKNLYANDIDLIKRRVSERDISYRFAHYFENNMVGTAVAQYDVDCEYNRDGHGIKQVNGTQVYPDLIIEFKTWWNPDNHADIEKIKWMMNPQLRYQYKFGCSIIINKNEAKIQWVEV